MTTATVQQRPFGQSYAWVVVAVTFVSLLAGAGLRSAPGVLMNPLEQAFGWDRGIVSLGAAVGIFLFGMTGPFAAALMQTLGIRRTLLGDLTLMAAAMLLSLFMSAPWQFIATWGVLSGIGSGAVTSVLSAAVVNRWFTTNRGLVMGLLSASTATGSLVFLPAMAALSEHGGWRPVVIAVAVACLVLIPLVLVLMPERPRDIGLLPYGATEEPPAPHRVPSLALAFGALFRAARSPVFWLLFGTFFVCGLTTNGLIGTHMIAFCGDHGIAPVQAAGLLAIMGVFDLIGTTASGWLTDRYDPRKLLFVYYTLRGLSLLILPFTDFSLLALSGFAVFYGLDWIATIPPTLRLATDAFGEQDAPVVFGWIVAGHQLGAAAAALGAGLTRDMTGSYFTAFIVAGAMGLIAAVAALTIRLPRRAPVLASDQATA